MTFSGRGILRGDTANLRGRGMSFFAGADPAVPESGNRICQAVFTNHEPENLFSRREAQTAVHGEAAIIFNDCVK